MQMNGNTILITGGGSGIGRAMAEQFQQLGNEVIIAGRRKDALDEVTKANAGVQSAVLDVQDPAKLKSFAAEIAAKYPKLNVLVNMAGVMKEERWDEATVDLAVFEETMTTNLLAPVRLTAALLPLLRKQEQATVMMVTSGLAFVPLTLNPAYCATKAAIHSWTESLRYQLKDATVEVLELIPPYVQTHLQGERQANDANAMPLSEFIAEVMEILKSQPESKEIAVQRVYPQRYAMEQGWAKYKQFFTSFNDAMVKARR